MNRHSNLLAVEEIENKTSIRYFSSWQQFDQKKKQKFKRQQQFLSQSLKRQSLSDFACLRVK